jgi:membrane protein YdbS with pleckstrin-like domain
MLMLRQAWNAYRGWAKLARDLQSQTQRWNLAALCFVIAAAVFGAIASVAPNAWSSWVAGAAMIASAVGAYLGRQIVGAGDEAQWIQARATAEGIKSECYRYAARAGGYAVADADAAKALAANTAAIAKQATDRGLVRADNPVPESGGDKREPPAPMTKDWYVASRIQDQIGYYRDARARNQKAAGQLWWVAFAAGLLAVVFGAAGIASAPRFAPWIGAMTTVAAAIAAYGLIDRRKYLIASYAAMQSKLEEILGLDAAAPMSLADLVTTTEDLLDSEHQAWLPQMLGMQHQPPAAAQPPAPPQPTK